MVNDERLKKLEERKAKLDAEIRRVKARMSQAERKDDTRRKILLGAYILAQKDRKGPEFWQSWVKLLDGYLTEDRDRSLFGLPPLAISSPFPEPSGAGDVSALGFADSEKRDTAMPKPGDRLTEVVRSISFEPPSEETTKTTHPPTPGGVGES